jgi:preprotein translocase subunit SecG
MEPEVLRRRLKLVATVGSFFLVALFFYVLQWRGVLLAYLFVVTILAVLAVLIQSGRGGGLAASIGGLGGDALLGVHSATPIAKATYVMLALFLFILMLLARLGPGEGAGGGVLGVIESRPQESAPVVVSPPVEVQPVQAQPVEAQPVEATPAPEAQ